MQPAQLIRGGIKLRPSGQLRKLPLPAYILSPQQRLPGLARHGVHLQCSAVSPPDPGSGRAPDGGSGPTLAESAGIVVAATLGGGLVGAAAEESKVVDWSGIESLLDDAAYAVSQQVDLPASRGLPWLDLPNIPVMQNFAAAVNDAIYSWSQDLANGASAASTTSKAARAAAATVAGGSSTAAASRLSSSSGRLGSMSVEVPADLPTPDPDMSSFLRSSVLTEDLSTGVSSSMAAASAGAASVGSVAGSAGGPAALAGSSTAAKAVIAAAAAAAAPKAVEVVSSVPLAVSFSPSSVSAPAGAPPAPVAAAVPAAAQPAASAADSALTSTVLQAATPAPLAPAPVGQLTATAPPAPAVNVSLLQANPMPDPVPVPDITPAVAEPVQAAVMEAAAASLNAAGVAPQESVTSALGSAAATAKQAADTLLAPAAVADAAAAVSAAVATQSATAAGPPSSFTAAAAAIGFAPLAPSAPGVESLLSPAPLAALASDQPASAVTNAASSAAAVVADLSASSELDALKAQLAELDALRLQLSELRDQLPGLQAQVSELAVSESLATAAAFINTDALQAQVSDLAGSVSAGVGDGLYTASQALTEVQTSLGAAAVASGTGLPMAVENPRLARTFRSLLESVDGALGEIYAADSLVLGGVVITLALSVAIRGAVVASRASDEATMRRYKDEAAVLAEMGVVPLPVMALDAAITLNRDANAILVDVRTPSQARTQGSPNLGAFRGGKVGIFSVPFCGGEGGAPDPMFASRIAQMKDIYSKTRIYLIDGDGFTAQEAAAAIRAYGVRCTEINWIDDGFIGPAGWQACGLPVRPGHVQVQDLPQMAAGSLSTMRSRVASLLTPEGIAAVLNPASYGLAGGATSNAADGVIGGQEGSGGGGVGNGGKQGAGMGLGLGAAGAALASSWGVISKAAVALAALQLAADKASGKPGDTSARFRDALLERYGSDDKSRTLINRAFAAVDSAAGRPSATTTPSALPAAASTRAAANASPNTTMGSASWRTDATMALELVVPPKPTADELVELQKEGGWYMESPALAMQSELMQVQALQMAATLQQQAGTGSTRSQQLQQKEEVADAKPSSPSPMRLPSLPSLGMSGKDWSLSSFKDALPKLNVSMPVLPSMDMSALQALGNQAAEAAQDKSSRLQAGMQARIDNMTSSIKDGVNQQRASLSGAGSPAGSTTSGSASEQAAAWSASAGLDASPPSSPSPSSSPLAGAASVSVSLAQELGSTLGWAAAALGEILTGPPVATTPDAAAAKLAHQAAQYERVTAAAAAAAADDTDAAYAASGSPARGVRGGSSGSSMGWRDTDSTTVEYGMRASGQKAPANWREAAVSNGSTAAAKSSASSGSNSNSHARAAALSYVSSSAEPSPPPVSPSSAGAASAAAYGSPTAAAALPWAAPASQAAAAAPRSQPQQAAPATAASSPSDRSSSPSDRSYSPGRGTWREELNRLKQDRAELAQSITRTNQAFGAGSSSWQDPSAGNNTQGPQSGADGGSFSMRGVPANVRSSWRALVDEEEAYTVAASLSSMRRGSAGGGGLGAASVRVYADDAGDGFEEEVEVVQVRR